MKINFQAAGAVGIVLASLAAASLVSPADAAPILVFGQQGLSTPITSTANGAATTISASDVAVTISGIDAAIGFVPTAYFSFSTTSTDAAQVGADGNIRQNFTGSFKITSETGGLGTNYLSGSFKDLFEALNSSATLIASTPDASAVLFTSDVIPLTDLQMDRAISLSFTGVTPGVTSVFGSTTPSFNAAIAGNFSADDVAAVPEVASWAMFVGGFGLLGGALRRKKVALSFG